MEPLELTFQYSQKEYVKAERQYLIANKTVSKANLVFVAIIAFISGFYLFFLSFSILGVVTFTVALLATIAGLYLYIHTPVQKFKENPKFHEEYFLKLTSDTIYYKTPSVDSVFQWDIYAEIWESRQFFFLIQGPRVYSLIPKRAFNDDAALQSFRDVALPHFDGIIKNIK